MYPSININRFRMNALPVNLRDDVIEAGRECGRLAGVFDVDSLKSLPVNLAKAVIEAGLQTGVYDKNTAAGYAAELNDSGKLANKYAAECGVPEECATVL